MITDDSSISQVLRSYWKKYLFIDDIDIHDNYFEQGGDNLAFQGLVRSVETHFNIEMKGINQNDFSTLYKQELVIKRYLNILPENNVLFTLQEGDESLDLPIVIAIHPLAGTLFSYMKLIREMKAKNRIYGVQDCIFSGDLRKIDSVAAQAEFYIHELKKKIQSDQCIILMGYSAGGVIANEIAFQLQQQKYAHIEHIILFDSWVRMPFSLSLRKNLVAIIERNFDKNKPYKYFKTQAELDYWLYKIIWYRMSILFLHKIKPLDIEITVFEATEGVSDYKVEKSMMEGWVDYAPHVSFYKALGKHENMLDDMDLEPMIAVVSSILHKKLDSML